MQHFMTPANGRMVRFHHYPGERPGILLIGGFSRWSALDKPLGKRVLEFASRQGQDLVVMDLPGQELEKPNEEWSKITPPEFTNYIVELGNRLNLKGRLGVAASLGAWALLRAQELRPSLLWNALLLAPAVNWDLEYFTDRARDGTLKRQFQGDTEFMYVKQDGAFVRPEFFALAPKARLSGTALKLSGPIRILQGRDDRLVSPAATQRLVEFLGKYCSVSKRQFDNVGHELSTMSAGKEIDACFEEDLTILLGNAVRAQRMMRSQKLTWEQIAQLAMPAAA